EAENTLLRGFTTVRDAGGPSFALKQAIDNHILHGPRIFPSGAMVSQTSGHGDFRMRYEIPATPDQLGHSERAGVTSLANGQAQVLQRVREQLLLGATRSEEHTSELQSRCDLVCRLLLEKTSQSQR